MLTDEIAGSIEGRHKHEGLQGGLPLCIFLGEVLGDPGKIIHQGDGVLKHIVVDPLQGVAVTAVSDQ